MSRENRRLAAVMFTDMVGYSSLAHRDELLSLELLREHRAMIRPLIESFRGREVSTTGDGFVVEFTSTEDAIQCALEIQKTFGARNLRVPDDRKVEIRIGVHIGDVLGFDDDIYGDGVNIAARLQPLAPAGGICVSHAVYEQIQARLNCAVHSMGMRKLKGIRTPVRVYSVDRESPGILARVSRMLSHRPKLRTATAFVCLLALVSFWSRTPNPGLVTRARIDPLRLAVLPFDSAGIPDDEAYLPDGLTGAVISGLSRNGVHVLAKASVIQVKKAQMTPEEIGRKLQIGTLVTGMVMRDKGAENALRVTVSLIDTSTQEVSWSGEFEGKTQDLYEIQDKIVTGIVSQFRGRQIASIPRDAASTTNKDAYLAYLKGAYFLGKRTKSGLTRAISELQEAVKLDPRFAQAYAALANSAGLESYYGVVSPMDASLKVVQYSTQALALDPHSTDALMSLAEEKAYTEYDFKGAEKVFLHAIADDPQSAMAHQWYGEFLAYTGRFHEGLEQGDLALQNDPLSLVANVAKGVMLYYSRDYDAALQAFKGVRDMDPDFMLTYYWMGRAYVEKRDYVSGIDALKKAVELSDHEPMMIAALGYAYAVSGQTDRAERLYGELSSLSKSRYVSPYHLATLEASLGHSGQALRLLRLSVTERAAQAALMGTDPELDRLRTDPGFAQVLAEIKPRGL